jgi:hypothetical protein
MRGRFTMRRRRRRRRYRRRYRRRKVCTGTAR